MQIAERDEQIESIFAFYMNASTLTWNLRLADTSAVKWIWSSEIKIDIAKNNSFYHSLQGLP